MSDIPMIAYWRGQRLDDLSKEQLIAIIMEREASHSEEIESLQRSRKMWMRDAFERLKVA